MVVGYLLTATLCHGDLLFVMGSKSSPALLDGDGDGLGDAWEMQWFGPEGCCPDGDEDGDGLLNLAEQAAGSPPLAYDGDGDGVADAEDGCPCSAADADGDGMADDWETRYLGGLAATAGEDADGDGCLNLDEWLAGLDPVAVEVDDSLNLTVCRVYRPVG